MTSSSFSLFYRNLASKSPIYGVRCLNPNKLIVLQSAFWSKSKTETKCIHMGTKANACNNADGKYLITQAHHHKISSGRCLLSMNYCTQPNTPPKEKKTLYQGSLLTWGSILAVIVGGTAGVLALKEMSKRKDKSLAAKRQVAIGKPDLGGDWVLTDHEGNRRTNKDFLGKWIILYFGFSFCPDICPEQMEKLVEVVDRIDDDRSLPNVIPIFITLDPERDTPVHLAKYVAEFSPKVIGMTGSPEQIAHAAKAYRIYYSAGPKDEDNDYIVDHSIIKYLVNPDGKFQEYFGQNKTASEIYTECKRHMKNWKSEASE